MHSMVGIQRGQKNKAKCAGAKNTVVQNVMATAINLDPVYLAAGQEIEVKNIPISILGGHSASTGFVLKSKNRPKCRGDLCFLHPMVERTVL